MAERLASTQQIHKRLLYMGKTIASILERNNIPYSISYGTLLGAVRHKGFIPWDEDFDLWLFDDSYQQAMECLQKDLPDDMFLENEETEPLYFHAWAHVKDKNSFIRHSRSQQDDSYTHHGLYVDMYRLWKMKECELAPFLNQENRRYIERRRKLGLMNDEEYSIRMNKLLEDERKVKEVVCESQEEIYALLNVYQCKHLYAKYVFPLKKYKFEDTEFFGINRADCFLKDLYGDYMTPPSVDKRGGALESVELW